MKRIMTAAVALLLLVLACTTEKVVYVLPDGTEVTPTAAQATQAAGGVSQAVPSQAAPASAQTALVPAQTAPVSAQSQAAPVPTRSASLSVAKPVESQQQQDAFNPRWNDRRNTLCASLGLDASLCERITLNQTGIDDDEPDIELPDEPDATPVPIDDVGAATGELNEIVAAEGEVSIQVLTYTENLIQQAADAVVQAEQELANQEATAAYLDAKKQELQELRLTYARLLEGIGLAQDRSLALAEQIEQEHLQFSIERANGEALIRYKDARLAHTNALAEAERNATLQIDAIASVNDAASEVVAERIDLAPLYKRRDEAQEAYDAAVKRFEEQVHQYEKNWLDVYEVYIADPAVRDVNGFPFEQYRLLSSRKYDDAYTGLLNYHCPLPYLFSLSASDCYFGHRDIETFTTGIVPPLKRQRGEDGEPIPQVLTLFRNESDTVDQEITRAIALNEKSQSVAEVDRMHTASIGIAVSNARLAVVDSYREHGISEGRAGAIFRFTDSGEDAVTYNLSLTALNRDAAANLEAFQASLNTVLDTLDADIRSAGDTRSKSMDAAEDARYASADTVDAEEQGRTDWQASEALRSRIVLMDALMMSAGWGIIAEEDLMLQTHFTVGAMMAKLSVYVANAYGGTVPGLSCPADATFPFYKTVTGIGRDEYIRQYWHKEQPLDRTYTAERLKAVESVVDNLEKWLQDTADMWWNEHEKEYCDSALEMFKSKKQEIISENSLPTD